MEKKRSLKIITALCLVVMGIAFRTIWHPGDNIEFVTTAAFLAGAYLGWRWSIFVPLTIMVITDLIIGNTNIFVFTWSAYIMIGIFGFLGLNNQKSKIIRATGIGIAASAWFYIWTNFGVWMMDSWGMYPKTVTGLLQAYFFGLPFLKLNLLGNIFFVPLSFFIVEKAKNLNIGFFKKLAV